uniref:C2H2-type domain-containing protein n=1 Tax=Setaria digitata TaxID=48799 RepID=A0A915PD06_9BILA
MEEANVMNGIVLRNIEFGEEIIICNESEAPLLEPSTLLQKDKHGPEPEMAQLKSNETDHTGGYKCDRCGKMFTYAYYREKHLKYTRCVDRGDRKFRCSICPRSFEKRDRLRIHILHVHENHRPHVCSTCGKSFSQSSSLNKRTSSVTFYVKLLRPVYFQHFRVHSGERPYKCAFCNKSFTASSILRTHIRQHSGEKPFQCANCGKSFASHAAHDSHVRRTHQQHQLKNIYRCTMCQKTFEHELHLNFHQQCVHSLTLSTREI